MMDYDDNLQIYEGDLAEPDEALNDTNNIDSDTDSDIYCLGDFPAASPMTFEAKADLLVDTGDHERNGNKTPENARRRRCEEGGITPVASELKRLRLNTDSTRDSVSVSDTESAVDGRQAYLDKKKDIHNKILQRFRHMAMAFVETFESSFDGNTIGHLAERSFVSVLKKVNWNLLRYAQLDKMSNATFIRNVQILLFKNQGSVPDDPQSNEFKELMKLLDSYLKKPFLAPVGKRGASGIPIHQPFSFAKFSNEEGDLILREIAVIDDIQKPLGSAFDLDHGFIFTGAEAVYGCSENGEEKKVLVKNASKPSAIAIIKNGERFAFLDSNGVHTYNWYEKKTKVVGTVHNARGLAHLGSGILVTMCRTHYNNWDFVILDANHFNRELSFSAYGTGLPSFLSSYKNNLYVSDLDMKTLSVFEMGDDFGLTLKKKIDLMKPTFPKELSYPSGIAVDRRREVILADAHISDGALWWGSANLDEWRLVKVVGENLPYCASIAISPNGYLLAVCRRSNGMKIYKFEEFDAMPIA